MLEKSSLLQNVMNNGVSVDPDDDGRMVSLEETMRVFNRIKNGAKHGGITWAALATIWRGDLRWARNRASMTTDRRTTVLFLLREIREGRATIMTNQIDDSSVDATLAVCEKLALRSARYDTKEFPLPEMKYDARSTATWSDATFNRSVEDSAKVVRDLTGEAESRNLMSAGFLEYMGSTISGLRIDKYGREEFLSGRYSQAQCTVTVRHPKGEGSGWAGVSRYDINRVKETDIAARALDKCVKSLNAVRIEPGRYTVVLEPQAVGDLVNFLIETDGLPLARNFAENRNFPSPFYFGWDESVSRDRSKLGMKVMDERITIEHNPTDPELGILAPPGTEPVTWVKNGVLTELNYDRYYALRELNQRNYNERRASYRMSGGTTSVDEMIASTKRGLLVTRFYGMKIIDQRSRLVTGVTRDGLFLIENGVVTKPVRNFRFTESPLFVLNNVVDLGVPEPIYAPFQSPEWAIFAPPFALTQVIVPPIKANDFSFTSTIDAV